MLTTRFSTLFSAALAGCAFSASLVAANGVSTDVRPMAIQPIQHLRRAPLQVAAIETAGHHLASSVFVVNTSDKQITQVQMGWVIHDHTGLATRTLGVSRIFDVTIQPGDYQQVPTLMAERKTEARFLSGGSLRVGPIYARFSDGTQWSYFLRDKAMFQETHNPDQETRMKGSVTIINRKLRKENDAISRLNGKPWNSCPAGLGLPTPALGPSPDSGAAFGSLSAGLKNLLQPVLNWVQPKSVHAQIGWAECWAAVCNPGRMNCYVSSACQGYSAVCSDLSAPCALQVLTTIEIPCSMYAADCNENNW